MQYAIEVHDLKKSYGEVEAVRGVDLEVRPGEVLALLGPNGAGKTTTVEILEGYRLPSSGEASVLGHDPGRGERSLRERIGIVLQDTGVQLDLTVAEVIDMYGRWYPRRRQVAELVDLVGLDASADTRVGALSGGQRRRLDLALGLVGDPELIFLDEPTTGFDPAARRAAWSTVRSLCEEGRTVLLTTHHMDEAQALADRVAVIANGQIVAAGTPSELGGRDERPAEIRFALPDGLDIAGLREWNGNGWHVTRERDGWLVQAPDGVAAAHTITGWALERGIHLRGFSVTQPTLEDVYLQLTEEVAA